VLEANFKRLNYKFSDSYVFSDFYKALLAWNTLAPLKMVTVRGNALIGSDLTFIEDVRIKIDVEGAIIDISKEQKPIKYVLPPSYVIIPGFINGHTHVGDAFLKDQTYGLNLEDAVGPNGVKHTKFRTSSKEEKIKSIKNSLELLVQNGYTSFIDFREEGIEGIELLKDELERYSIRGIILGRQTEKDTLEKIIEVSDGLGIRDIFSVTQDDLKLIAKLKENNSSKLVAIHASESEEIITESISKYGKRDIEIIGNCNSFDYIVHATYSKEEELKLLSKNKISVICCPISSLYNGLKFPPLELISKNKILLGLGTDNVLFCNPDPFRLMAFTLYNARSNNQNLLPREVLKSVTVNPGLIVKRKIGQLEVGYSGDLIAIDLESNNLKFSKDVYSAITMRADQSDIRLQMYKGKVIKWKNLK